MFEHLIEWVRRLFGKAVSAGAKKEMTRTQQDKMAYEDTGTINFDSIFAGSLANKTVTDCDMTITDANDKKSKRSEFINSTMRPVWRDIKSTVSQALGKGGKFLIPYVSGVRVFVAAVDQSKVAVTGQNGAGEITSVSVVADLVEVKGKPYQRIMDYTLENGVMTIRNRAVNQTGEPVPLDNIPEWQGIMEEFSIRNVNRMLMGFLKCPRDSRREHDVYGVPITYGTGDTKRQLYECIRQIEKEYQEKRVKVFADETLFSGKNDVTGDLFKVFSPGGSLDGKPFYELFDPSIRDVSYYARFNSLCTQLEKEVGTSRGILTEPASMGATATEIKAANHDTFCMVSDIRKNIETCLEDVAYAIDVLAEFFGLTPAGAAGDYKLTFDWDTSLIESSSEKFEQLSELESRGGCSMARLNSYVTGQSMEDAQSEIDAVEERKAKAAGNMLQPEDLEP